MTGRDVAATWRDRSIRAWLPDRLVQRDTEPTQSDTVRATERARQNVIAADARTPREWEPLARLLLRAEGVASSYIEGVRATVPAVALAQFDPQAAGDTAAWVAANLHAIDRAVAHARGRRVLTLPVLNRWHHTLMAGHAALADDQIGALRTEQGWIGGTSPLDAALVTPPPAEVPDLMADLIVFVNRADIDPIAQAAAAHAQFEIVHPYADGNGRLGRVLILWVLARRTGVRVLPPVSVRLATDTGGYLSGLTLFRVSDADAWIRWFADTVSDAAGSVSATMAALADLTGRWQSRLDDARMRRDAAARRLLAVLPSLPVLNAAVVAEQLAISDRSARTALALLAGHDILAPLDSIPRQATRTSGRPTRWWYAPDVVDLVRR